MVTLKRMRSIDAGLAALGGGQERRPRRRVNILKTGSAVIALGRGGRKRPGRDPAAGLLLQPAACLNDLGDETSMGAGAFAEICTRPRKYKPQSVHS